MSVARINNVSVLETSYISENYSYVSRRWGNQERPISRTSFIRKIWRDLEGENRIKDTEKQQKSGTTNSNLGSRSSCSSEVAESEDVSIISTCETENECPPDQNQMVIRKEDNTRAGTRRSVCGRQDFVDLLARFEIEREREIQCLLESRFVSNFGHRNRIQALLRGRFLLNQRFAQDEKATSSAENELGLLRQTNTVSDLRKGFLSRVDSHEHTHEGSQPPPPPTEVIENSLTKTKSTEEEAEDSLTITELIEEDSVEDNLTNTEDLETNSVENEDESNVVWYNNYPVVRTDALYASEDDNDNRLDLQQLASGRRVSNLLQSDFRVQLEHVIQSYLERHNQAAESDDEWMLDQDTDQQTDDENDDVTYITESAHSSLTAINQHSGSEWEMINGLRIGMLHLQEQVNSMQSTLETCMNMQLHLQRSVQQELSSALSRLSTSGESNLQSCFLCSDFDSTANMREHVLVCSKCAEKINWSKVKESVRHP